MSDHYFTEHPKSKKSLGLIKTVLHGKKYQFMTSTGVFSARKLDNGTRLLIENMELPLNGRIHDLGCGYGPIGIVAARLKPELQVWMTDINERAIELSRINAINNKVYNVIVEQGNLYKPVEGIELQAILSNPPISAGLKKVVIPIIDGSLEHLSKRGSLQIVVQSNKGGQTVRATMEEVFGSVEIIARGSGYRVLRSTKQT